MTKRGRKPVLPELKKTKLQIYVEKQKIEYFGSIDANQKILLTLFTKYYEKAIRNNIMEKRR